MSTKKVTWKHIYEDFAQRHPKLSKRVVHYHPHSYATIKLYFDDMQMIYDYDLHRATIIS